MEGVEESIRFLTNQIGKKIFVRCLSPEIVEGDLIAYFSQFGNVSKAFIARCAMGQSKTYGFVTFREEDASGRVFDVQEHSIGGMPIYPGKAHGKVYFRCEHRTVSKKDLLDHFMKYGNIMRIKIPVHSGNGRQPLYGFITFEYDATATFVQSLGSIMIGNVRVFVEKTRFNKGY